MCACQVRYELERPRRSGRRSRQRPQRRGQGNVTAVPEPSLSLGERVREAFPELAGVGTGHLDLSTDVGGCRDAGGAERIRVRLADADAALYDSHGGRFLSTHLVLTVRGFSWSRSATSSTVRNDSAIRRGFLQLSRMCGNSFRPGCMPPRLVLWGARFGSWAVTRRNGAYGRAKEATLRPASPPSCARGSRGRRPPRRRAVGAAESGVSLRLSEDGSGARRPRVCGRCCFPRKGGSGRRCPTYPWQWQSRSRVEADALPVHCSRLEGERGQANADARPAEATAHQRFGLQVCGTITTIAGTGKPR